MDKIARGPGRYVNFNGRIEFGGTNVEIRDGDFVILKNRPFNDDKENDEHDRQRMNLHLPVGRDISLIINSGVLRNGDVDCCVVVESDSERVNFSRGKVFSGSYSLCVFSIVELGKDDEVVNLVRCILQSGIFRNCLSKLCILKGGNHVGGDYLGCVVEDCVSFTGGLFFKGKWKKGTWNTGLFKDSDWLYHKGTFAGGVFVGGTWEGESFKGQSFKNGVFRHGSLYGCNFIDSVFERGVVIGSVFQGSVFESGTWRGGKFYNSRNKTGVFKGGDWKDGTWYGGVWEGGDWVRGKDKSGKEHFDSPDNWSFDGDVAEPVGDE